MLGIPYVLDYFVTPVQGSILLHRTNLAVYTETGYAYNLPLYTDLVLILFLICNEFNQVINIMFPIDISQLM